jgi:hypothetical protein
MINSASRLVLILTTITVCAAFLCGILEPKEFMMLASMVFAFYFTKTNNTKGSTPED